MAAPVGDAAAALEAATGTAETQKRKRNERERIKSIKPAGGLEAWLARGSTVFEVRPARGEDVRLPALQPQPPFVDAMEEAWDVGDASGALRLDISELSEPNAFDRLAAARAPVLPKLNLAGTEGRQRPGQAGPQRGGDRSEGFEGGGQVDSSDDERAPPPYRRKKGWAAVIAGRQQYFAREASATKSGLVRFASAVAEFHSQLRAAAQAQLERALERAGQEHHPCHKYGVPAPSPASGAPFAASRAAAAHEISHALPFGAGAEVGAAPPGTPLPERSSSGVTRTVYALEGDLEVELPKFTCHKCGKISIPRAEHVGFFEVQMEPPNTKRIYWVDIRLLEQQKYLSLRKMSFSGAWRAPRRHSAS